MSKNIRRSARNKSKNKEIAEILIKSQAYSLDSDIQKLHADLLSKKQFKCPNIVTKSEPVFKTSCRGCRREEPPVKRNKQIHWISCDGCQKWWHIECACIRKEDKDKIEKYKIDYNCAYCVIDLLPKPEIERESVRSEVQSVEVQSSLFLEEEETENIFEPEQELEPSVSIQSPTKSTNSVLPDQSASQEPQHHVVIVDNINCPKNFRSSIQITEKIKKFDQLRNTEFAFSLAHGGIALHFKSEEAADRAVKDWPEVVFNTGEVPHRPTENKVNFMKNVDTNLSDKQIGEILTKAGIKYSQIKRLHYRFHKGRMPVVKLLHPTVEDKKAAQSQKVRIPISFQGRHAYVEPQKNCIVRCFNCQRFGHTARLCNYEKRCEKCGLSDHLGDICGSQVFSCANCSGNHRSSAKVCPVFLKHAIKRRNTEILKP
ncbi:MAG: hypothetical protein AB2693_27105 [Candidatus Thiodiazotropha sp.]